MNFSNNTAPIKELAQLLSQMSKFQRTESLTGGSGATIYFNNFTSVTITRAYLGGKHKGQNPGIRIDFPNRKSLALIPNTDSTWVCASDGKAVGETKDLANLIHNAVHSPSILNKYRCTARDEAVI